MSSISVQMSAMGNLEVSRDSASLNTSEVLSHYKTLLSLRENCLKNKERAYCLPY